MDVFANVLKNGFLYIVKTYCREKGKKPITHKLIKLHGPSNMEKLFKKYSIPGFVLNLSQDQDLY